MSKVYILGIESSFKILHISEKKIQQTSDDVNVIKDDTKATEENLRKMKCCCCFTCPFRCVSTSPLIWHTIQQ